MKVTITISDEFAEVAKKLGMSPEAFLTGLANQEMMKHFREQKDGSSSKLLLG